MKGYDNFFCGTESIFRDIMYFLQKLASFMVLCVFLIGKNANVDNFYSKSQRWRANLLIGVEREWQVLLWNRKHIQEYNVFSSEIGLIYGTLYVFGRTKCWRWNFYSKSLQWKANLIPGIERLWQVFLWNRKHIQWYNVFSSEIGLLYSTLCILW